VQSKGSENRPARTDSKTDNCRVPCVQLFQVRQAHVPFPRECARRLTSVESESKRCHHCCLDTAVASEPTTMSICVSHLRGDGLEIDGSQKHQTLVVATCLSVNSSTSSGSPASNSRQRTIVELYSVEALLSAATLRILSWLELKRNVKHARSPPGVKKSRLSSRGKVVSRST
jgi:hypothetical protein